MKESAEARGLTARAVLRCHAGGLCAPCWDVAQLVVGLPVLGSSSFPPALKHGASQGKCHQPSGHVPAFLQSDERLRAPELHLSALTLEALGLPSIGGVGSCGSADSEQCGVRLGGDGPGWCCSLLLLPARLPLELHISQALGSEFWPFLFSTLFCVSGGLSADLLQM